MTRPLLCLAVALAIGCDPAPAPAPARLAAAADASAPNPAAAPSGAWGVSYRRAGWSLLDPPLVHADTVLFDRARFRLVDGRLLGPSPDRTTILLLDDGSELEHDDGLHLWQRGRRIASAPAGVVDAIALSPDRARLASIESSYSDRRATFRLVVRSAATLREERDEVLVETAGGGELAAVAWRGDDALIVVVPKRCRNGRCSEPRLEHRSGAARRVVARDFDAIALEPSGRAALIVNDEQVSVLDTETGAVRWKVSDLDGVWPQTLALAPDGDVVALGETHQGDRGGGRLRIYERDGSGARVAYEQPLDVPEHLAFHVSPASPAPASSLTLLVSGQGFAALRRGARAPRPELPYAVRPPEGFERGAQIAAATELPELGYHHRARGVTVLARGLEVSELAGANEDRAWAALAFRRLRGVAESSLSEPRRAFRVWRDARGRHAELVVPACNEGVSNSDDYLRVSDLGRAVVFVELIVLPGTARREVRSLLATFVDAPLGSPPDARELPALPARSCGI